MTTLETRPLNARLFQREALEHYSEPFWCSARLFAEEKFESGIWDPCCGVGRIPDSAVRAGMYGIGTDIVDRGYRDFADRLVTAHPPSCPCDACFVDDLNAVLRRFVEEREIREHNAAAIQLASEQSAWRDTVGEGGR